MLQTMKNKTMDTANRGMNYANKLLSAMAKTISNNRAEGFVDSGVKILISVVIGALLLAGLYTLFDDTILPTLTSKIQDLFNYSSAS